MEELTGFGIKNSITLPSVANKSFNSLRNENDEPIYTYNDEYMRYFVRKSIKGGGCAALNQYINLSFLMKFLEISPLEFKNNGSLCEILYKYFEYINKNSKLKENEYDSQFEDYRDTK